MSLVSIVRSEILKRIAGYPIISGFLWQYGVGRTKWYREIRYVNAGNCGTTDLQQYLKQKHPQTWYDDESDALFFMIYDYIVSTGLKVVIKELGNYRRVWIDYHSDTFVIDERKAYCILSAHIIYSKYHRY